MDNNNRWRNRTVAFRVSPEEDEQLEVFVKLSGLTKQDYITRRLTHKDVVVQGNPRVYKALRDQLAAVLDELYPARISKTARLPDPPRPEALAKQGSVRYDEGERSAFYINPTLVWKGWPAS